MGEHRRHAAREHAGQDVRPDHAAVPQHHAGRPHARARTAPATTSRRALLAEDDPSFITDETVTGTVAGTGPSARASGATPTASRTSTRDTDAGAIFGAGYAVAETAALLLNQARDNGIAGADRPAGRARDQPVLGLYAYKPSKAVRREATAQQTQRSRRRAGTRQAAAARHRHLPRRHQRSGTWRTSRPRGRSTAPTSTRSTPIKAQFLGRGRRPGGRQRAVPRRAARQARRQARRPGLRGPARGATTPRRRRRRAARRRTRPTSASASPRASCGSSRARSRLGASSSPAPGARPRAVAAPRAAGVQHPDRLGQALGDGQAAVRRRPADRLQLPRPDDGDAALRPAINVARRHVARRSRATC